MIDPGHGGKDPGTKGADVLEKTLTLRTAKKSSKELESAGRCRYHDKDRRSFYIAGKKGANQ
ncbi:N-acetylmuramoyl-L-alanine amidase [Virgibacillus halophilus]|uniref:N-acetylmuramoyl-L-alanine amidase n=1 Tax=Tigheibacillus halophilus TaxID=361280 RepID=A0ABU5C677_9BACI|nr:N-acetylmuramoyl-L-alanine amidase [Virgibacillus halophilus]